MQDWTTHDTERLREAFPVVATLDMLGRELGRSQSSIRRKAQRLGLSRPQGVYVADVAKYRRDDFFECIDTSIKAYILGLLAADGCIDGVRVRFEVKTEDRSLADLILKHVSSRNRLAHTKKGSVQLSISSPQMVNDLKKYNVVERKSLTFKWPDIPGAMERDFLLGYFDGDGSLSICPTRWIKPRVEWCIIGTLPFLIRTIEVIRNQCGVVPNGPYPTRSKAHRISASHLKAERIEEWINESGLGLPRKHL